MPRMVTYESRNFDRSTPMGTHYNADVNGRALRKTCNNLVSDPNVIWPHMQHARTFYPKLVWHVG